MNKPNWVTAKLVTRFYRNGVQCIRDEVPLGKIYKVDLNSQHEAINYNLEQTVAFTVVTVMVDNGRRLPLEVLDVGQIVEGAKQ